jgi:hypothetical protein
VTFPECTAVKGHKQRFVEQTCKCVQEELWSVPSSLANEVTAKVLYWVNRSFSDLFYSVYRECEHEVLLSLLSAILHPALTRLEIVEDMLHAVECHDFMWDCVLVKIHDSIHELVNLKVLRYGHMNQIYDWIIFDVNISENLEHFSSLLSCNDIFLRNLAAKYLGLKSTDVRKSMHVTDQFVECLLKFEHLEELNVSEMGFGHGLTRPLIEFSQANIYHSGHTQKHASAIFKSFGCYQMSSSQMKLLVGKFQNLTSICRAFNRRRNLITPQCRPNISP